MSKILRRDDILNVKDIKTELVEVPEWGGSVYVRGLTAKEADIIQDSMIVNRNSKHPGVSMKDLRASFCAACVVDEQGNKLFTAKDIIALGEKSISALEKIHSVAEKLSNVDETAIDRVKEDFLAPQ